MDRWSTESPDQESNFSGEVNGVLQENNDPEDTFSVLEVPEPTPDSLNEGKDNRAESLPLTCTGEPGLHSGVLSPPSPPRGDLEGSSVTAREEERCRESGGPESSPLPCRDHSGSAETWEVRAAEPDGPQAPLLDSALVPSSLRWAPSAEQWLRRTRADEGSAEEPSQAQGFQRHAGAPGCLSSIPWRTVEDSATGQKEMVISDYDLESVAGRVTTLASALAAKTHEPWLEQPSREQVLTSSDEEDIYAHGLPSSSSETSVTELSSGRSLQDLSRPGTEDPGLLKADQVCGFFLKGIFGRRLSFWEEILFLQQTCRPHVSKCELGGLGAGLLNDSDRC